MLTCPNLPGPHLPARPPTAPRPRPPQLDIASAVQSSLKAYEEEEAAGSASSSSDDDGGGKKKRQKQKRNKTANFSSFRNKNFGFRLKDQKAIAETVAGGGMGAVKEEGEASD